VNEDYFCFSHDEDLDDIWVIGRRDGMIGRTLSHYIDHALRDVAIEEERRVIVSGGEFQLRKGLTHQIEGRGNLWIR